MAGPGGYRAPANPAPVSGPGALSQRTDGRQPIMDLPNAGYGENAEYRTQQAGAAMSQTPSAPPPSAPASGPPGGLDAGGLSQPSPLTDGSVNPDQHVTHGADAGEGPDLASLNLPNPQQSQYTNALDLVHSMASNPNASPALQYLAGALTRGF